MYAMSSTARSTREPGGDRGRPRRRGRHPGAQVLLYRGRLASVAYASNCGGRTRSSGEAGWVKASGATGISDGKEGGSPAGPGALRAWILGAPPLYCGASTFVPACHTRWVRIASVEDVAERARRIKDVGALRGVQVIRRDRGGRVVLLRVAGTRGELLLSSEAAARALLGTGPLRSSLYAIEVEEKDGKPSRVFTYGGGWGHGVGLCQAGAAGRAEAGLDADAIVKAYFPGTEVGEEPAAPDAAGKRP